jgi:hypothetical protein
MLTKLATFVHAHGRGVLLVAVLGAAIAGAFGFGVANHMSPTRRMTRRRNRSRPRTASRRRRIAKSIPASWRS